MAWENEIVCIATDGMASNHHNWRCVQKCSLTLTTYIYADCNMKSTENICMHFSKAFLAGLAVAFVVCVTFAEQNEDAANGGYYA